MRAKLVGTTSITVRRVVAVTACALLVASCGTDRYEVRAAQEVGGAFELLASAVDAGDRAEARRILQDLIRSVEGFREAGEIDAERADAILEAASQVSRALRELPAPTVSSEPSPSATSVVDPEGDEDEDGGDEGGHGSEDGSPGNSGDKGNGKAHGHDKD